MKTRTKRLLVISLAAFVVGAAWLFPPPPHQLLAKSVRVPGIHPGYQKDDYYWLSDHDLLLCHWVHDLSWKVTRRDVQAGTEKSLPALDHLFQQTGGQPNSVKVSPDHTRLIWAGIGKVVYGATLDGQQFQQWPYGREEVGISYWLNDSRRFLRYTDYARSPLPKLVRGVRLRSIQTPPAARHLPWVCPDGPAGWIITKPLAPSERLYAAGGSSAPDNANVTVSRLTATAVFQTGADVTLPLGEEFTYVGDEQYGCEGNALIWTTFRQSPPETPTLFWNMMARLGWRPKPLQTVSAYLSRTDGTQWHFVGNWQRQPPNPMDYYGNHPQDFRWLPGGKRLSFECQGALYTASVD